MGFVNKNRPYFDTKFIMVQVRMMTLHTLLRKSIDEVQVDAEIFML